MICFFYQMDENQICFLVHDYNKIPNFSHLIQESKPEKTFFLLLSNFLSTTSLANSPAVRVTGSNEDHSNFAGLN